MSAERDLAIARAVRDRICDDCNIPGGTQFTAWDLDTLRAIIAQVDASLAGVSGIDEAGESIGQGSEPATPSADATPPAQAAEPPSDLQGTPSAEWESGYETGTYEGAQAAKRAEQQRAAGIIGHLLACGYTEDPGDNCEGCREANQYWDEAEAAEGGRIMDKRQRALDSLAHAFRTNAPNAHARIAMQFADAIAIALGTHCACCDPSCSKEWTMSARICVECPACGFMYSAEHELADGSGYSCPECHHGYKLEGE
jgi:hypothetical protein